MVHAHFYTIIPEKNTFKKGETVNFVCTFGHPYEHEWEDARPPERVGLIEPDGTFVDLKDGVKTISVKGHGGKEVKALVCPVTPKKRGDSIFVLDSPELQRPEYGKCVQFFVKLVVHVKTQRGWDRAVGQPVEIVPLTRPYGLEAGFVFSGQALYQGKPLPGAIILIEKYNPFKAQKDKLPPDEMITRQVKTDPNGSFVCTLDEPGWWVISVSHVLPGARERKGKKLSLMLRGSLWLHVEERFSLGKQ
jgi:cobalt/nickel transport protein